MPFVALVMNLKGETADRSVEEEIALDCTATSWLPESLLSVLDRGQRAVLQRSLEQELLTLAMIRPGRDARALRITALAEEGLVSLGMLLQAFALRPVLLSRQREWVVDTADFAYSTWARTSAWADLLRKPVGRTLRFRLGTPLVVPSLAETGERRAFSFPHPFPVFAELARRWRDLGGPPLPANTLSLCEEGGCVVADYHLRTSPVAIPGGDRLGFLGWIAYECRGAATDRIAALNALARFAFFAGAGCYTSRGMGATRVTIES